MSYLHRVIRRTEHCIDKYDRLLPFGLLGIHTMSHSQREHTAVTCSMQVTTGKNSYAHLKTNTTQPSKYPHSVLTPRNLWSTMGDASAKLVHAVTPCNTTHTHTQNCHSETVLQAPSQILYLKSIFSPDFRSSVFLVVGRSAPRVSNY